MDIKTTEILLEKASSALPQIQKSTIETERKKADPTLSIYYYQDESGDHFSNPELIRKNDQRNDKIRRLFDLWCACENAKARILHEYGVL